MKQFKRKILKITGWTLITFFSVLLLALMAFYLGQGYVMRRAVAYMNEQQPGEVKMEKMNLLPFKHFPDVSLQLRGVTFYEKPVYPDSLYQEPVVSLNDLYMTLDVVDLVRGEIQVSEMGLKNGFIRLEICEDSVTNLEKALGLRLFDTASGSIATDGDTATDDRLLNINLDRIEVENVLALMNDHTSGDHIRLTVERLESSFGYHPGKVNAALALKLDIDSVNYMTYKDNSGHVFQMEGSLKMDPGNKHIDIDTSWLKVAGLELETWGSYDYRDEPAVDIAFRARNEGLELLNFLFRGVLDLDEIEQIGSGSIHLNGTVQGGIIDQLPLLRINGTASELGLRIKSLQKDITDINFSAFATNGANPDLSEGRVEIQGFTATFPDGAVNCDASVYNMISPEVKLDINGKIQLDGIEKIVNTKLLSDLTGLLTLEGEISGVVDRETGEFLNNRGALHAGLCDVGFKVHQDSITVDKVRKLNGELFLHDNLMGIREMKLDYNGNSLAVDFTAENLLLSLLANKGNLKTDLSFTSDEIRPSTLLHDTTPGMMGMELHGLRFRAEAGISSKELNAWLKEDVVPEFSFSLDSFAVGLPHLAEISDMKASLTVGPDTVWVHGLDGIVGESNIHFSGLLTNYGALSDTMVGRNVSLEYNLSSALIRAEDFFTFRDTFLLPETYQDEYLKDFHLTGSLELPSEGIIYDTVPMDLGIEIENLGWQFRYYPLPFKQFRLKMRKEQENLFIDDFRGRIGESNLEMNAVIRNFTDTLLQNWQGNVVLRSDLLDLNTLLSYHLPGTETDTTSGDKDSVADTIRAGEPLVLYRIDYPGLELNVNIGELRYGTYALYGLDGKFRTTPEKLFYLDSLVTLVKGGGRLEMNGQLNVADSGRYIMDAEVNLKEVDINDLDFELQTGDETYTLKKNFAGRVTANGMAELFISPDLKVDMSTTTASFNVTIEDGSLINFTPLEEAGRYLDNKDLDSVRFATMRNSFTLKNGRIIVPLMNVESTIGQLLIEGEQGLDNSYLYLVRVPPRLAMEAAKSAVSEADRQDEADRIQQMKSGKFLVMTVWSDGKESDLKMGDKREKFKQ